MNLGKRLLQARKSRGLKQESLAELAGTNQAAISALESRDSKTSEHLFALAESLRINPKWLQTGEGDSGLQNDTWKPMPDLPQDEQDLLRDYRRAHPDWRATARQILNRSVTSAAPQREPLFRSRERTSVRTKRQKRTPR